MMLSTEVILPIFLYVPDYLNGLLKIKELQRKCSPEAHTLCLAANEKHMNIHAPSSKF